MNNCKKKVAKSKCGYVNKKEKEGKEV